MDMKYFHDTLTIINDILSHPCIELHDDISQHDLILAIQNISVISKTLRYYQIILCKFIDQYDKFRRTLSYVPQFNINNVYPNYILVPNTYNFDISDIY